MGTIRTGTPWKRLAAFMQLLGALLMFAGASSAFAFTQPAHITTTYEGCRNTGQVPLYITNYICADAAYISGNLGKSWNELDLVPFRLFTSSGTQAGTTTTYNVYIAADYESGGFLGYDVISIPTVNAVSDTSCKVTASDPQTVIDATGITGGTDFVVYRLLTITQNPGTDCRFDWWQRLALGASQFSGSNLQAYIFTQDGLQGGKSTIPIPVKEILPQEIKKTMAATEDSDYHWTVAKSDSPVSLDFGNVCAKDAPTQKDVSVTITWTRLDVSYGQIVATATITATNPAARSITINLSDTIYQGLTPTVALDTVTFPAFSVPANSTHVFTHTANISNVYGVPGDSLNDVATATYTDDATGIDIPGTTTATASATIQSGAVTNSSASITDTESISPNPPLTFSVLTPSVGSFTNYTAGTPTGGPVNWDSGVQSGSSSVTFGKTVYLPAFTIVSGTLTDTATLTGSSGFTTGSGALNIGISSSASVTLTISKTIPDVIGTGEKLEVKFHVTSLDDATYDEYRTLTFLAGETFHSTTLSGLPGHYVVEETVNTWYPSDYPSSPSVDNLLTPDGGTQKTVNLSATNGVVGACSGSADFTNSLSQGIFAHAQVEKITDPTLTAGDPDCDWAFTLKDPTNATLATVTASACPSAFAGFGVDLAMEGTYTVLETTKNGWDLNSATPNDGTTKTVCSFTVEYLRDEGKTFSCTFKNTKRGNAQVIKTASGAALTGTALSFTFQLRQGATTSSDGTTLQTLTANAANNGNITFDAVAPGAYQMCEVVMPGWNTNLGAPGVPPLFVPNSIIPPSLPNPDVNNMTVCINFTISAGGTSTFNVDNSPPPGGRALTIGFWKNWASCTTSSSNKKPILDQTMAKATPPGIQVDGFYLVGDPLNPNVAPDCKKAVNLLNKSTFPTCTPASTANKKMASDPLFNMAAQLVAAELNLTAGAYTCGPVTLAIQNGNLLLTKYSFNGCTHTAMSSTDIAAANAIAKRLDDYNNDRPAACQP